MWWRLQALSPRARATLRAPVAAAHLAILACAFSAVSRLSWTDSMTQRRQSNCSLPWSRWQPFPLPSASCPLWWQPAPACTNLVHAYLFVCLIRLGWAQEAADLSIWKLSEDPSVEPERVRVVQTAVWLTDASVAVLKAALPFDTYGAMDDRVVISSAPTALSDFNLAFGDECYLQLVGLRRAEGSSFGLVSCNALRLQVCLVPCLRFCRYHFGIRDYCQ